MNMSDLNNLSVDNIGTWPIPVKIVFALIVSAFILGIGWWKDISKMQEKLETIQTEEQGYRQTLELRQRKAANLAALKQQLKDIEEIFGDLLKRLPNKTEVADLLVDISQQGLGAGLEFELFRPGKEVPADFYVELPIQIRVIGHYHEFGTFISGVADLPRIVTNHNISIKPGPEGKLILETTAKTYRYMDEQEEEASQ